MAAALSINSRSGLRHPVILFCAEERLRSVSATGKTPYSNSVELPADVARLAFCFRHLPMWASFRKKMIEDAMTSDFLQ